MITYQDAVLEVESIPVALPALFRPSRSNVGSAARARWCRTLASRGSKLGAFYEQPYYLGIDLAGPGPDDQVRGLVSTNVSPLLLLDYRKRFFSGYVYLRGSGDFYPTSRNSTATATSSTTRRGAATFMAAACSLSTRTGAGASVSNARPTTSTTVATTSPVWRDQHGVFSPPAARNCSASCSPPVRRLTLSTCRDRGALQFKGLRATDFAAQTPTIAPTIFVEEGL